MSLNLIHTVLHFSAIADLTDFDIYHIGRWMIEVWHYTYNPQPSFLLTIHILQTKTEPFSSSVFKQIFQLSSYDGKNAYIVFLGGQHVFCIPTSPELYDYCNATFPSHCDIPAKDINSTLTSTFLFIKFFQRDLFEEYILLSKFLSFARFPRQDEVA